MLHCSYWLERPGGAAKEQQDESLKEEESGCSIEGSRPAGMYLSRLFERYTVFDPKPRKASCRGDRLPSLTHGEATLLS